MRVRIHYLALVPLLAAAGFGGAHALKRGGGERAKAAPLARATPLGRAAVPTIVGLGETIALPVSMATTRHIVTSTRPAPAPPPVPQKRYVPPPAPPAHTTTTLIPVPQ